MQFKDALGGGCIEKHRTGNKTDTLMSLFYLQKKFKRIARFFHKKMHSVYRHMQNSKIFVLTLANSF